MNNDLFQQARSAYVTKDFDTALTQFTECLQDSSADFAPGELGLLYHQIGNCLVKLHDPDEAIHAYSQASVDSSYDAIGSVNYNLGMVYASRSDYENAVSYFKKAIDDSKYPTPHKAYLGMGNALLKMAKSAEAGAAFRSAALDPTNPDPTKALLNLGVCFMALDRPMDAIASYESSLQFDMSAQTRNRMFANMGQAYVAAGKMNKAVRAFESALSDKTYVFNDAANVDYQRAVAAVASGAIDEEEKLSENDLSGLDVAGDGVPYNAAADQSGYVEASNNQLAETSVMPEITDEDAQRTDFFTVNNAAFDDWGRKAAKKRHRNRGLKIAIFIIVLLLVVVGGGLFAYTQGLGSPSRQEVVQEIFANPDTADVYASSVDDDKKAHLADMLVTDSSVTIQGETIDLSTSEMYVSATTSEGAEVPYKISLVRDGIGWKVSDISLYFTSQQN